MNKIQEKTTQYIIDLCDDTLYQFIVISTLSYFKDDIGTCYELGKYRITFDYFNDAHCCITGNENRPKYKIEIDTIALYFSCEALETLIKSILKSQEAKNALGEKYEHFQVIISNLIKISKKLNLMNKIIDSEYRITAYNKAIIKMNEQKLSATKRLVFTERVMHGDVQLLPINIRQQCINDRSDYYYYSNSVLKNKGRITRLNNKKSFAQSHPVIDFYIDYVTDFDYHIVNHKADEQKERITGILELERYNSSDIFSIPLCWKCLDAIINSLANTYEHNPVVTDKVHNFEFRYYNSFPEKQHCYFSGTSVGACYEIKLGYVSFYLSQEWKHKLQEALKKMRKEIKALHSAHYD